MDDFDDIPVAQRETRSALPSPKPSGPNRRLLWMTVGLTSGVVALMAGALVSYLLASRSATTARLTTAGSVELTVESDAGGGSDAGLAGGSQAAAEVTVQNDPDAAIQSETTEDPEPSPEREAILGHYPYEEIEPDKLTAIAPGIRLAIPAAEAYRRMESAASAEGVRLMAISGFRTKEDQDYLFFEVKGARGQTAPERAKVSAPPGHSEHHTGYAVDIGDADAGGAILNESFEQTRAFQWLDDNAAYYNFELSFPRGNPQGVSYEPWHWRYVGNQESLEIFHKGR